MNDLFQWIADTDFTKFGAVVPVNPFPTDDDDEPPYFTLDEAAYGLFVAYYGTRLCVETWGQSISELSWLPVGMTYAALPLGSAITLMFVIERIVFGPQSHRAIVRYEAEPAALLDALDGVDLPVVPRWISRDER